MTARFPIANSAQMFPSDPFEQMSPSPFNVPVFTGIREVLVEFILDSGRRQYSFGGLATRRGPWNPGVQDISALTREISLVGGLPLIADVTVTMSNVSREWSTILDQESIINRPVNIYFVSTDDAIGTMRPMFSGTIRDFEVTRTTASLRCTDALLAKLAQPVTISMKTLNTETFPNIPTDAQYMGLLVPVFYRSAANYYMPAYLIDPAIGQANYRYVVCQGALPSQAASPIRRYGNGGILGSVSLATATYDGTLFTVLDFSVEQREMSGGENQRPSELEIIHALGDGLTPVGPSSGSGSAIANPVTALEHFLLNFVPGLTASDFDRGNGAVTPRSWGNSTIQEAEESAVMNGTPNVVIMGNSAQTFNDVIGEFQESFNMGVFSTRAGKYGMFFLWENGPRDSVGLPPVSEGWTTLYEDTDIIENSYRIMRSSDEPITEISNYQPYDFARNQQIGMPSLVSRATFEAYLKQKRQSDHGRGRFGTRTLQDGLLDLLSPLNRLHQFDVSIDKLYDLDLARLVKVIHTAIPGGTALIRVTSLSLRPDPVTRTITVQGLQVLTNV